MPPFREGLLFQSHADEGLSPRYQLIAVHNHRGNGPNNKITERIFATTFHPDGQTDNEPAFREGRIPIYIVRVEGGSADSVSPLWQFGPRPQPPADSNLFRFDLDRIRAWIEENAPYRTKGDRPTTGHFDLAPVDWRTPRSVHGFPRRHKRRN